MSQNGKGSKRRPGNNQAYSEGYDRIFRAKRKPLTSCASDRDGECHHPDCPQIRDGEPDKSDRTCPLWRGYTDED